MTIGVAASDAQHRAQAKPVRPPSNRATPKPIRVARVTRTGIALRYGRPIATMAGAICGGLGGRAAVPQEWVERIEEASRIDLAAVSATMSAVVRDVLADDAERARARAETVADLLR